MYEGKHASAVRSQQELEAALMRLMQKQPFQRITITMLCQEANLSRQTFYQLFDQKEDVLRYSVLSGYAAFERHLLEMERFTLCTFTEEATRFFAQKKDLLNLMIRDHQQGIFLEVMHEKLREVLELVEEGEKFIREPSYTFFVAGLSALFLYEVTHAEEEEFHQDIDEFAAYFGNPEIIMKHPAANADNSTEV